MKNRIQTFIARSVAGSLLVFLLITLAAAAFDTLKVSWDGWEQASCWSEGCFCEGKRSGTVVQPVNTYSNLSYVLVGMLVVGISEGERNLFRQSIDLKRGYQVRAGQVNLMRRRRAYPLLYGISIVVIGLGSLFYHASLTLIGQWFDLMGMYMLISFILIYNLARLGAWSSVAFTGVYAGANLALGTLQALVPHIGREVFGVLMAAGLIVEIVYLVKHRRQIKIRYLAAAVGSFLLAYGIWILDNTGIVCNPTSIIQGHAAWHLLTAAAAGLIFFYYRSEKEEEPQD